MNTDFPPPPGGYPVQFQGSRLATAVLRGLGWHAEFDGLPALQGMVVIYPHTSSWDFVIALLLKWAIGIPVQFWSKDALFRIPGFGAWLRWVGGVPINRTSPHGVVGHMVAMLQQKKASGEYFWLALSPEGTRKHTAGWRSGFYRVALAADVPVGLAALDYSRKRLVIRDFVRLTGNEAADMARIAASLHDCKGVKPDGAAPVQLLDRALTGPKPG